MDINARLEKLEIENRRMKKIGIVAAVFAAVLFISGQAKTNKSPVGAQKFSLVGKAVVEANEFRLVDPAGNVRAKIFFPPDSNDVKLIFQDEEGHINGELGASSAGRVYLNLGKQPASVEHVSLDTGIPGSFGPTLILGNVFSKSDGNIMLTAGKINSVSVSGSAGIFLLHTDGTFGGPRVILTDNEGYSTILGRADLETVGTGRKTRTPAASVVLFGKDKKVPWSAP